MIYETAKDWRAAKQKSVALIGMSGVGKTRISAMMRDAGDWFHYSVDYRIGTRYLDEAITDRAIATAPDWFRLEARRRGPQNLRHDGFAGVDPLEGRAIRRQLRQIGWRRVRIRRRRRGVGLEIDEGDPVARDA